MDLNLPLLQSNTMLTIQHWLQEFVQVTDDEIEAIQAIIETAELNANEAILKQGHVSSRIGLLVQGAVRTYFTDKQGNDKVVGFVFEGQPLIAVDSFFNQLPSSVSTVTLEPCVIVWTDLERYNAFITKFPKYNKVLISGLAKWFAEGKDRMEYLHQPLAKDKYDKMCELHPKIIERVPLKYIASYLGITQETLSRIRGQK
jgi:CRP-like cAMP-binding protein